MLLPPVLLAGMAQGMQAQNRVMDSLRRVIAERPECDSNRVLAMVHLAQQCINNDRARCPALLEQARATARRLGFASGYAFATLVSGKYHYASGRYDSAHRMLDEALTFYRKIHWGRGIANAHLMRSMVFWGQGRFREAGAAAREGLRRFEELGEETRIAEVTNLIGVQYFEQGMKDSAAVYFDRAIRAMERLGQRSTLAAAYANMGNVQTDNAKALEYYQKSLALHEETGDLEGVASTLLNISSLLGECRRAAEAHPLLERALGIAEKLNDLTLIGQISLRLGGSGEPGGCRSAIAHYRRSIAAFEQTGNEALLALPLIGLGRSYLCAFQQTDSALLCGQRALGIAERTGNGTTMVMALRLLADVHAGREEYDPALNYFAACLALKDSLYTQAGAQRIAELTARYEADRREDRIAALEKDRALQELELARRHAEAERSVQQMQLLAQQREIAELGKRDIAATLAARTAEALRKDREFALASKERQLQASLYERGRARRNTAIGGLAAALLLVLLSSLLVVRRLRERKRSEALRAEAAEYQARAAEAESFALQAASERREKEAQRCFSKQLIDSQEHERKRIAGELHDGLGQVVLVIGNTARLAMLDETDPARRDSLERIASLADDALGDVRTISRNLRPIQLERVGITETLHDTVGLTASTATVRITDDIADIDGLFSPDEEINIYRIVQEALTNMLKHSRASQASVRLARENGRIHLTVADDGVGIDAASLQRAPGAQQGFGLHGMAERVTMLGGTLAIRSEPGGGTCIDVLIPVTTARATDGERATEGRRP